MKIGEERFNPNHGADGKFISGGGTKHAPDLGGGIGGGDSGNSIDKSEKSGIIKKRPKPQKIGINEKTRLSHQIATEYPNLKPGTKIHNYSNRNHFYRFTVNGFGSYSFKYKIPIDGNEDFIRKIRKKG